MVTQNSVAVTVIAPGGVVDVSDRATRLLGTPASFAVGSQLNSTAGNVSFNVPPGQNGILKSAVITTNATVANRGLQLNATSVATKLVAASQTNADLIDRELAVTGVGNNTISVVAGQAGDTWVITYLRLI